MRIFDMNNLELTSPDLEKGYLMEDLHLVKHHGEVPAMEEVSHLEYGAYIDGVFVPGGKYPTGGQDAIRIIDTPGQERVEAWDEFEEILRYIEYSKEELAKRDADKEREKRIEQLVESGVLEADLEELYEALGMILSGVTE